MSGAASQAAAAGRVEQAFVHKAAGVFDRSSRGILDLSGKNAGAVLHGIFSSSVKSLLPGKGQPSSLLTAKGKLIAAFCLHALSGDAYRIVFFEPLREAAKASINKYAFLSDIQLVDRSDELAVLGIEGPLAAQVLSAMGARAPLPAEPLSFSKAEIAGHEAAVVRGGESPEKGYELWVKRSAKDDVLRALAASAERVGGGLAGVEAAEALRIEAGLAVYGKDYDEECFPNEVGWDAALTYDKCYVGQEVVARIKTYGHVNRKLRGLVLEGQSLAARGDRIRSSGDEAGKVTSGGMSARLQHPIHLGLIKSKFFEATEAIVDTEGGPVSARLVDVPMVTIG